MRRIAVRGIIVNDGKVFAQCLRNKNGTNNYWCTPGGGLDDYESLEDGLRREMIEETGIEPTIGKLLAIQQYRDDVKEHLEFFYHIINTEDYNTIDLSATTHGLIEVHECRFIDPKTETILPEFLKEVSINELIESTQPMMLNYL